MLKFFFSLKEKKKSNVDETRLPKKHHTPLGSEDLMGSKNCSKKTTKKGISYFLLGFSTGFPVIRPQSEASSVEKLIYQHIFTCESLQAQLGGLITISICTISVQYRANQYVLLSCAMVRMTGTVLCLLIIIPVS